MVVGTLLVLHEPASASVVRREIAADLTQHAVAEDSVADVVLVASELVGNAIRHAEATPDGKLDIAWEVQNDAVIVRVDDGSDSLPHSRPASHHLGPGGRGLTIVSALADDWGVDRHENGKQVWARVPIHRLPGAS